MGPREEARLAEVGKEGNHREVEEMGKEVKEEATEEVVAMKAKLY